MNWDVAHPFLFSVSPQADDIDGLNHTNNAVYVRWCEQAGWAHSEALGLSLDDYRQLDRAMAIRHGGYDYLLPTFLGEQLTLGTWLSGGEDKLTMRRHFQLLRDSDGACVLRGYWDLVCIDIGGGRARRMPPQFIEAYVRTAQAADPQQTHSQRVE